MKILLHDIIFEAGVEAVVSDQLWSSESVSVRLYTLNLANPHKTQIRPPPEIWDTGKTGKSGIVQSCNEDSSKILGEGRWYWIHDFVVTFGENNKPIYMELCS